jgi:hypothetical protein
MKGFLNSGSASSESAFLRLVSGVNFDGVTAVANGYGLATFEVPNVGQSLIYISTAGSAVLTLTVQGFGVSNGDS